MCFLVAMLIDFFGQPSKAQSSPAPTPQIGASFPAQNSHGSKQGFHESHEGPEEASSPGARAQTFGHLGYGCALHNQELPQLGVLQENLLASHLPDVWEAMAGELPGGRVHALEGPPPKPNAPEGNHGQGDPSHTAQANHEGHQSHESYEGYEGHEGHESHESYEGNEGHEGHESHEDQHANGQEEVKGHCTIAIAIPWPTSVLESQGHTMVVVTILWPDHCQTLAIHTVGEKNALLLVRVWQVFCCVVFHKPLWLHIFMCCFPKAFWLLMCFFKSMPFSNLHSYNFQW